MPKTKKGSPIENGTGPKKRQKRNEPQDNPTAATTDSTDHNLLTLDESVIRDCSMKLKNVVSLPRICQDWAQKTPSGHVYLIMGKRNMMTYQNTLDWLMDPGDIQASGLLNMTFPQDPPLNTTEPETYVFLVDSVVYCINDMKEAIFSPDERLEIDKIAVDCKSRNNFSVNCHKSHTDCHYHIEYCRSSINKDTGLRKQAFYLRNTRSESFGSAILVAYQYCRMGNDGKFLKADVIALFPPNSVMQIKKLKSQSQILTNSTNEGSNQDLAPYTSNFQNSSDNGMDVMEPELEREEVSGGVSLQEISSYTRTTQNPSKWITDGFEDDPDSDKIARVSDYATFCQGLASYTEKYGNLNPAYDGNRRNTGSPQFDGEEGSSFNEWLNNSNNPLHRQRTSSNASSFQNLTTSYDNNEMHALDHYYWNDCQERESDAEQLHSPRSTISRSTSPVQYNEVLSDSSDVQCRYSPTSQSSENNGAMSFILEDLEPMYDDEYETDTTLENSMVFKDTMNEGYLLENSSVSNPRNDIEDQESEHNLSKIFSDATDVQHRSLSMGQNLETGHHTPSPDPFMIEDLNLTFDYDGESFIPELQDEEFRRRNASVLSNHDDVNQETERDLSFLSRNSSLPRYQESISDTSGVYENAPNLNIDSSNHPSPKSYVDHQEADHEDVEVSSLSSVSEGEVDYTDFNDDFSKNGGTRQ